MLQIVIEALMQPGGDLLPHRPVWQEQAACRGMGPELFFPHLGESTLAARRVCARCVVVAECRTAAVADLELQGIWGGTAPNERRALRASESRMTASPLPKVG